MKWRALYFICFCTYAQAADVPACFPPGGFTAEGAIAKNARELQLKSGETIMLGGIYTPEAFNQRASIRLAELLEGQPLRYRSMLEKPDRYGRLPAEVAAGAGNEKWLQGTLVEEGLALVMPAGIQGICSDALREREKQARLRKAGLWSLPGAASIAAGDKTALMAAAGQFRLIEGKILSVGKRDYATFLNFGRFGQHDFAVIVLKKNRDVIEAAHKLDGLKGKRVRVRGVLTPGALPRLTLVSPSDLEILE